MNISFNRLNDAFQHWGHSIIHIMLLTKIKNIFIKAGKFLAQILPFKLTGLPTDTIFFKTLTGCGATTMELSWPRPSVIIEPNVPVIIGKMKKHKDVLGIYEKTTSEEIEEYLARDIKYKKIIVTPESFYRIKDAIGESIYEDYFLLMDECERTIQDVSYRSNVILPMFDFFKFKNKAFISATPIIPSDPRFKEHNFKILKLTPTFEYREPITIINSNNIILTLQQFLKDHPREKYFFFFNSTENIADIITKLNLREDCAIYCSRDSRKKLRLNGYTHVHTELRDFKKYNFLTSRFYSAVDIDYHSHQCNPTVIMLTDLVFAPHTMIDPGSEAIQIVGRFRKDKKVEFTKEIFHITNTNPKLESMTRNEVYKYIDECHLIYSAVERFYLTATTRGAKDTIRQMLERCDYRRFINEHDGSRNYYMVDNMIHEEKVKRAYQSKKRLLEAYKDSKAFILKYTPAEEYAYTDNQRLENRKSAPLKSLTRIVSDTIKDLHSGKYTDFQIQIELANLQLDFPSVMAPINKIGLEDAAKLNYDLYKIKAKIEKSEKEKDSFGLMTYIKDNFTPGHKYTPAQIEHSLSIGIRQLNLTGLTPGVRLLRKFCEIPENRSYMGKDENGNDIRGYLIIRFWDNVN
ncbi:MAG: hypothetical protein JWM44_4478 [Bacilli bacterium]|nr:hypothetical protein [Bacilli bacterium]